MIRRNLLSRGLAAGVAGLLMLAGGAAVQPAEAQELKLVKPDTLTVVGLIPYPLFLNGTPDNVTGGLHYDLVHALADELGVSNVEFKTSEFAALVAGAVTGYDLGIMEINVTEARTRVNQYTNCYRRSYNVAIVPKGTTLNTLEDLKALKWGTQPGSSGQDILVNYLRPDNGFQSYPTIVQHGVQALKAGFITAIITGLSDTSTLMSDPDFKERFEVGARVLTTENPQGFCVGIQLPKDSPNLPLVNAALKKIMDAKRIEEWQDKYGIFVPEPDVPTFVLQKQG